MNILRELIKHSPSSVTSMGLSFIWTKLFFPKASLIRRPFFLRGKRKNLVLNNGFRTGRCCRIELYGDGMIVFGKDCHIGDYVHLAASDRITIGDDCLFASKIFISDTSHGEYGINGDSPIIPPEKRPLVSQSVKIGNNVWLGDNVVVLSGVTIGDGCVIGANSTVTKDIKANTIAVGSPAKPIKEYDFSSKQWKVL